jgi:hypothetical protein
LKQQGSTSWENNAPRHSLAAMIKLAQSSKPRAAPNSRRTSDAPFLSLRSKRAGAAANRPQKSTRPPGMRPGATGMPTAPGKEMRKLGRGLSALLHTVTLRLDRRSGTTSENRSCARNCRPKPSAGIRRGWHWKRLEASQSGRREVHRCGQKHPGRPGPSRNQEGNALAAWSLAHPGALIAVEGPRTSDRQPARRAFEHQLSQGGGTRQ